MSAQHLGYPLVAAIAAASMLGLSAARLHAQQRAANPHGALTIECATCHASEGWTPARVSKAFQHPQRPLPLVSAHARAGCRSCHKSLAFSSTPTTCASCHSDVHRGELGVQCERCHTPRSFIDRARMQQSHQTTRLPLTGAHAVADCESCHVPARQGQMTFVGKPTECIACHATQYAAAKDPDHVASGFPRDCGACHAPTVWDRARFDHAGTRFPLTGAHRTLTCDACHADKVFKGKIATCVGCHQADYVAAADPPHVPTLFPTTCETCHSTARWQGATFDHDARYFPIYSGAHRGRWTSCSTCHTSYTTFTVFTCLTCHEQPKMDDKHKEISGYRYESTTCYGCHKNGKSP